MSEQAVAAPGRKKVRLSSLKTDMEKERNGDWMPALDIDPTGESGIRYFVRSTNFPAFKIARDAIQAKLARKPEYAKAIPEEVLAELYGKLAVDHLLLGWEGLVDDDGVDIQFSREKALQILQDPEYKLVRGSIYMAASRVGLEEVDFVEDGIKN